MLSTIGVVQPHMACKVMMPLEMLPRRRSEVTHTYTQKALYGRLQHLKVRSCIFDFVKPAEANGMGKITDNSLTKIIMYYRVSEARG